MENDPLQKDACIELGEGQLGTAVDIWAENKRSRSETKTDQEKIYDILSEFENLLTEEAKKSMTILALRQVIFGKIAENDPTLFTPYELNYPLGSLGELLEYGATIDEDRLESHDLPKITVPVVNKYLNYLDATPEKKIKAAMRPMIAAAFAFMMGRFSIENFESLKERDSDMLFLTCVLAVAALPIMFELMKRAKFALNLKSQGETEREIQEVEIPTQAKKLTRLYGIIRTCAQSARLSESKERGIRRDPRRVAASEIALALAKKILKEEPEKVVIRDGDEENGYDYAITFEIFGSPGDNLQVMTRSDFADFHPLLSEF